VAVVVLVVAALAGSVAYAQKQGPGGGLMARGQGMMGGGFLGMARLALGQLGLTDQQKAQVKEILASHKTEFTALEDRAVPAALLGLDIGPRTVDRFRQRILSARTVYWEGPLGRYEQRAYAEGSTAIARALAATPAAVVVAGAGAAAVVAAAQLTSKMKHVSTGGDATLEFLEGRVLPGVKACEE
jgi:3-phosphoglycerate kinase